MLQPSKDHPLPILWVLQRTSWWRRRGAVLESVSFLGKQQQSVQVDKFILWGQEILSRNNVPFPAATDCQPCGWFCFHRNVHACFLPSTPGTPWACLVHTAQNYQAIPPAHFPPHRGGPGVVAKDPGFTCLGHHWALFQGKSWSSQKKEDLLHRNLCF
jgi:hypothetical protein